MAKKTASESAIAFTLYYKFNLFSLVPILAVWQIASNISDKAMLYILIFSLPFLPISYFSLKQAAKLVSQNYIITDKAKISPLLLKYLLLLGGVPMILSAFFTGYISAVWVASAVALIFTASVIHKFTSQLIQESTKAEIGSSAEVSPEPHLLKRIGKTALLSVLGFILFIVIPLIAVLLFGQQLGQATWLALAVYYSFGIFFFFKHIYRK